MQPKRGDVVLYSQGGKVYNALVLVAHSLNDSHLGKKAEPTLHLAVLFDEPAGKTPQLGSIPEVSVVHDVVHASHAFSQAYMETHGLRLVKDGDPNKVSAEAGIRNRRGAGEWSEAIVVPESELQPVPEGQQHAFRVTGFKAGQINSDDLGRGTSTEFEAPVPSAE